MGGRPEDTSPEAWEHQIEVYRRLGPEGNARLAESLTRAVYEATLSSIRQRHPEYDQRAVVRAYVALVHGEQLARRAWPDQPVLPP